MSAEPIAAPEVSTFQDASPRAVRAALVPEEQPDFDHRWRKAMAEATATLDLSDVFRTSDSWRRRAMITTALGHGGYRRMLAKADERLRSGEAPQDSVSADEIKAYVAERLGQ